MNHASHEPFLPFHRPRRNRYHPAVRGLIQESTLLPRHLVKPLFLIEGEQLPQPIESLPGVFRLCLNDTIAAVEASLKLGITTFLLFPFVLPEHKDLDGHYACDEQNLLNRAVKVLKKQFPEACFMADVALDPYMVHGHDGVIDRNGIVENDATLKVLGAMAHMQAQSGVDVVAPSDMMDGRVQYIRGQLDRAGFSHVGIMSYAAKYASSLYGPFREALQSAPKMGDKRSYQLNPANRREALREIELDIQEGADILLVKPASLYLDIIHLAKEHSNLPVGAYHVSGEYAMAMAAEKMGWLDATALFVETCLSCRRAGADFIITYAADRLAQLSPL
jgi:porphobilinogen synthase